MSEFEVLGRAIEASPYRRLAYAAFFLATLSGHLASAQEIEISGRVLADGGRPLQSVKVELLPLPSHYELALQQLEAKEPAGPVAATKTNRDGDFSLEAPDSGFWKVVLRHPDHLTMAATFQPLLGPKTLPDIELPRRTGRRVRIVDGAGKPVAGARVMARGHFEKQQSQNWQPDTVFVVSSREGQVTLPAGAGMSLAIAAISDTGVGFIRAPADGAEIRLQLSERLVDARVVDDRGRPVPDLLGLIYWPMALGVTGPEGELRVPETGRGSEAQIGLQLADASGIWGPLSREEPEEGPVLLRLPGRLRFDARAVDAKSRAPVRAWFLSGPGWERADRDGTVALQLPEKETAWLQVVAPGYLAERLEISPAMLRRGELRTLALTPTLTLAGRVTDAAGEGLEGARIEALPTLTARFGRGGMRHSRSANPSRKTEARAGGDGRFRLTGLAPEHGYELRITCPGYAPDHLQIPPFKAGEEPADVAITLESGLTALGLVLDEEEQAVAGAEVRLLPADASFGAATVIRPTPPRHRAVTTSSGRFEIADLPPGSFFLQVSAEDYAPLRVPGIKITQQAEPFDLGTVLLERGVSLTGTVTNAEGEGIEGAWISAIPQDQMMDGSESQVRLTTGADGSFTVENLRAGSRLGLSVVSEGYRNQWLDNLNVDPAEPLHIVLEPSNDLVGQVVTTAGEPVGRAQLEVHQSIGGASSTMGTQADADGKFRIGGMLDGKVTITARRDGGVAGPLTVELPRSSELRLVLQPVDGLSGSLTDPEGLPVLNAEIRLKAHQPGEIESPFHQIQHTRTDIEGRFTLPSIDDGHYRLEASHPEFVTLSQMLALAPDTPRELTLAFTDRSDREELQVSGQVIDPEGAGLDGAVVRLAYPERSVVVAQDISFADGRFLLSAPDPGRWVLLVEHSDFSQWRSEPIELGTGAVSNLVVQLERGGTIQGRILGLELEQLSQVVLLASSGHHDQRTGQVSYDGTYRISHLGPEEYQVSASLSDSGRRVSEAVTVGSGGDVVEVDLTFAAGYRLRGIARRGGKPLHNMKAEARCPSVASSTMLQAEGRFQLDNLAGDCEIMLSEQSGRLVARRQVKVERDIEVELDVSTSTLSGQVLAATGSAIAGAKLELRTRKSFGPILAWAETDSEGRFDLGAVDRGQWFLQVTASGFVTLRRPVDATTSVDDLQVVMESAEPLVIFVKNALGEVPPVVHIRISGADGRLVSQASYQAELDGRIVIRSVGPGTWKLNLSENGGDSADVEAVLPGPPVRVTLAAP